MNVLNDRPTVFFDVDSTLVFTAQEAPNSLEAFNAPWVVINDREFLVHSAHVESIKDFHARGHNVIVWSAGGAAWSATVVEALGLTKYVWACLPKPFWVFDDKPVEKWLNDSHRTYLKP